MAKSQTCFSKDADMTNWLENKVNSWCYDLKIEKSDARQARQYFKHREVLLTLYELELIEDFEYKKYANQLCDVTTGIAAQMRRWRN